MTSQQFRIDVRPSNDAAGQASGLAREATEALQAIQHTGIANVSACNVFRLYFVQGTMTNEDADYIARALLADPVTEEYSITSLGTPDIPDMPGHSPSSGTHSIHIMHLPGVTDPAAENLVRAAHMLGMTGVERAATGQCYMVQAEQPLHYALLQHLASTTFCNPVIQQYSIDAPILRPFAPFEEADDTVETIPIRSAEDAMLSSVNQERRLALDVEELRAIRDYFQGLRRDPTDVELETLAQTWSEHCVHKTFRASIRMCFRRPLDADCDNDATNTTNDNDDNNETYAINGLLDSYIRAATEKIGKPWVRSAFVDNAGIVTFNELFDLAFKVETHNHPSALEPFGGANTGVGGVVRDILGVSARPIANTDVLCFGPPDLPDSALPEGVLHPRRVAEGVIYGIEDYGNKMGIPTVNGAICYHAGYTSNPLVFCGCLGILPRDSHPTEAKVGDYIVAIGGRTGRDGLRGATFSSMEMDQTTSQVSGSAVQIGHPINEKQVMEVVLRARDAKLYDAITDCGAGGFASAVGEMGRHIGARVQLKDVPLKYPGLRPWEIWLSEAQERMVLAVPPENVGLLEEICAGQDVEMVRIGTFEATGKLTLLYGEKMVGELDMDFLHKGMPTRCMMANWYEHAVREQGTGDREPNVGDREQGIGDRDVQSRLLALLSHPTIGSKEHVVRRYDHEVQGGTTVKPLVGVDNHGPGDATVLIPLDKIMSSIPGYQNPPDDRVMSSMPVYHSPDHHRGVALSVGICPHYGEVDPYAMAWAAVDEAMRNVVAVGADPDCVALLDNFCWGNPKLPDRLGGLVRCVQGCYDAALAYDAPFISGKDSLNNEYRGSDGYKHAIPGTLLISALGVVPDVRKTVTMDFKQAGDAIYIVGNTHDFGRDFCLPSDPLKLLRVVHRAIAEGFVLACHDCSEGGIGVALAEMCIAGRVGAEVALGDVPVAAEVELTDDEVLFAEALCRFVVEVSPDNIGSFEALVSDIPHACIGDVTGERLLRICNGDGADMVHVPVAELEAAFCATSSVEWLRCEGREDVDESVSKKPLYDDTLRHFATSVTVARGRRDVRCLIVHANGTNRDREAYVACVQAGAVPEIVHVNQLLGGERRLLDYHMLVVPGGFSYGDDLGAGTLWAHALRTSIGRDVEAFVASGRPVLGICNGFQTLLKAGFITGGMSLEMPMPYAGYARSTSLRSVTLAPNESGHFECRWVYLRPDPASRCLFTRGLDELVYCPVAHGEGRLVTKDDAVLRSLQGDGLVALTYATEDGADAVGYPANPNGSVAGVAGLCNKAGNVLGMMPHPEDHVFAWQHPRWSRGESGMVGLRLFENGVRAC